MTELEFEDVKRILTVQVHSTLRRVKRRKRAHNNEKDAHHNDQESHKHHLAKKNSIANQLAFLQDSKSPPSLSKHIQETLQLTIQKQHLKEQKDYEALGAHTQKLPELATVQKRSNLLQHDSTIKKQHPTVSYDRHLAERYLRQSLEQQTQAPVPSFNN